MRLLYVIDSLAGGGAETSLAEMAPYLVKAGIDLHVLPLKEPLDLAPRLEAAGATVHGPAGAVSRRHNIYRASEVTRHSRPDHIHTTLFEADLAGRLVAARHRIPASTSWVNQRYVSRFSDETRRSRQMTVYALDRMTCKIARRFHAVSNAVAVDLGRAMGVHPSRVEVIPRGRDPQRFQLKDRYVRTRVRADLDLDESAHVILAVGRQEPQKALHLVIEAADRLSDSDRRCVVVVAGREGRATRDLHAAAGRVRVDVRFLGHRSDIPDLMAAADVLAFPSEREGSPGTLIEAMAVGLPIVSSDIAPCIEVLGGSGQQIAQTVPTHDSAALRAALAATLADPLAAEQRAQLGRERFEQHYAIEAIGARMATFFQEAAES